MSSVKSGKSMLGIGASHPDAEILIMVSSMSVEHKFGPQH